eukprot:TRINITY_DN7531_c0_g1_i1.p1 TRINITY_DN7531_c0_g1~~TRINITY_DN7531_c0_g1_i1.p1  ORF type:complete len:310 (-),score=83.45 TRINITY_DN7531_c0_g1_i1:105-1034(-)
MEEVKNRVKEISFITRCFLITCILIFIFDCLFTINHFLFCSLPNLELYNFQVWRIYTCVFLHQNFLHLLFNMMALVNLGKEIEKQKGSINYLIWLILMILLCGLFLISISWIFSIFNIKDYMNECSIGASGLLFTMLTLSSLQNPTTKKIFCFISVPNFIYPWLLLIIIQLFMPNVSFVGHLAGILTGFFDKYVLYNLSFDNFSKKIEKLDIMSKIVNSSSFVISDSIFGASIIQRNSSTSISNNSILPIWNKSNEQDIANGKFPGQGFILGGSTQSPIPSNQVNTQTNITPLNVKNVNNNNNNEKDRK